MEIPIDVGGALLSASFSKLFDMLASPDLRQFCSKKEVQSELHKWENMLPKIHAVLEDAEHKESTSRLVKIWLSELRDLVYDMEDVLDEFATQALRIKHQAAAATTTRSNKKKVQKILGSWFTAGSNLKLNAKMESKLKEITGRLEMICRADLGDKGVGGRRGRSEITTSPSPPDSHFFGRDKDKHAILDLLLADGGAVAGVSVIPIQGMGGLGKTTLAQKLYDDEKVKVYFQLRAWVCVSDTFDILSITQTILQYVGGVAHGDKSLDQLQVALEKTLSERKFLIVLDDVWNENYEDWEILCKPFFRGAPGSKIIVTTRNHQVAVLVGTTQAYHLGMLSVDDCLSLFAQQALGATSFDGDPDLKDIGLKIVRKCQGLPLAVKILGRLLRTKVQRDEWEYILNSQIWNLQSASYILPALRLSYHHLPSQLKQCFVYCAIFPKDHIFDVDELVRMWMAEGYLSHTRMNCLEDVGNQIFGDLLSRSFFQPFNEDSGKFVMHNLIHDLAQDVAGEICFHVDTSLERGEHLPTPKTRHMSFSQQHCEVSGIFGVLAEAKGLRTLLALPTGSYLRHYISVDVLENLLLKLGNLRLLSLSGYAMGVVPGSVVRLKHLRYINLSQTVIRFLPEFVCSLLNLQTLLLTNCEQLEKLPTGIGNIPNLCHLDIRGTKQLKEMPPGIGNLIEIRTLGKFIVGLGKVDGLNIRELKNLLQLKGELCLEGLHNVENSVDAREADLKGKQGLQGLVIRWSDNMDDHMSSESVETEVLELLQPHRNVERLAIKYYCGMEFPSWLGDPLLMISMTRIELCNCRKSTSLPSLGRLPMLKHLIIKGMTAMRTLGFEFFGCDSGGFLALETLKFEDMHAWEKWCSVGTARECGWKFPCLHELEMLNCPVLVGECLVSLPSLRTLKMKKCNESFLKCMVDTSSLTSLSIEEMSGLSCLHDSVGQLLVALEELEIYKCEHLVSLWQTEAEIEDNMRSLRSLRVKSCPELVSLVTRATLNKMTSLEKMIVEGCPKIGSILIDKQHEIRNGEAALPPSLRLLKLVNCGDQFTESLDNGVLMIGVECVLVDYMKIKGCDTLQHLAIKSRRGGNKVKHVRIENCRNLVSLSNSYEITSEQVQEVDGQEENDLKIGIVEIEELDILNCPSLTSDGLKSLVAVKRLRLEEPGGLSSLSPHPRPREVVASYTDEVEAGILEDQGSRATQIQLMNKNVTELPESPDCPNLKSLFLQTNSDLTSIPASFFELMPNLKEVDLSETAIKSLPQSFFNLATLQKLFLRNCQVVMELPALIGQLYNLEVLDLQGTYIIQLPAEIGDLIKLTCLKVSFCQWRDDLGEATIVPEGALLKLAQLVELWIDVDPEDSRWERAVKVVVKELGHLKKLKDLKMYIPQVELLDELTTSLPFLLGSSTTRFNLNVGRHMRRVMSRTPLGAEGEYEYRKKHLRYISGKGSIPSQVKKVLKYSEALFLDRHFTVGKLSEFGMKNLDNLRFCMLGECNELQTIVEDWDGHDLYTNPVLPKLEQLVIYNMKTLTSISNAPLKDNSLCLLKTLKLHGCAQLRTIFVIESGIALVHLEEITVEDCPAVLSLVTCSKLKSHGQIGWSFPKLKKISLLYLTELQSIFSGLCNAPHLERLSVYDCPNLKTLSAEEISRVDRLKVIRGEEEWWEALERNESEDWLQKLASVFVPIRDDADLKTQLSQDPIIRSDADVETLSTQDPIPEPGSKDERSF